MRFHSCLQSGTQNGFEGGPLARLVSLFSRSLACGNSLRFRKGRRERRDHLAFAHPYESTQDPKQHGVSLVSAIHYTERDRAVASRPDTRNYIHRGSSPRPAPPKEETRKPNHDLTKIDEAGRVALTFTSAASDLARVNAARTAVSVGLGTEGDTSGHGGCNVVHIAGPASFPPTHSTALFIFYIFAEDNMTASASSNFAVHFTTLVLHFCQNVT